MSTVNLKINGQSITTNSGRTVLEVALENGIYIPHLCYDPRLKPFGACRLCLVEVEGANGFLPACATTVADGMSVVTDSLALHQIRKTIVELLLSDHPTECMVCESSGECLLQDLAYNLRVERIPFKGEQHSYPIQDPNPLIERDYNKCILCGRCVRICDEVQGVRVYDFTNRGFKSLVTTPFNRPLLETDCEFCGQCISSCPVGALVERPRKYRGRIWEVRKVETICPYCGCGCTLELHIKNNQIVRVSAPLAKGVNQGNLCVKGRFGYDFVNHPDRLTTPLIKRNGQFEEASWEKAIALVASKLTQIKKKYGVEAIAGLSSAKCTNEENFVFQKFIRAVIGTNNVDHCARLCHGVTVPAMASVFGSGAMTNSVDDIAKAKAILVIGSNTTEAHPIVGIEVKKAVRENGAQLVVIDSRRIRLVDFATVWLRNKPGTDLAVLNGLLNVIVQENLIDKDFIASRTEGFEELKAILPKYTPEVVEKISGVPADLLRQTARIYGSVKPASIIFAMGIAQRTTGFDNVLAVANLALATGNIGKEGAGVNPLRGQNNVQGACDMAALPHYLPGYQSFQNPEFRAKFENKWGVELPSEIGLTVVEISQAALQGKIKAMYIMGENVMISDPDLNEVEKALKKLDFLVVQDIFLTETAKLADVVLPAVSFAEKDGTFTDTDRRVQKVRRAINPIGQAREDWQIICAVSQAMGYQMSYHSPEEIMAEISELIPTYGGIRYDRLESGGLQWPCPSVDHPGTKILHQEKFVRGLGKFSPVEFRPAAEVEDQDYPLILTTGRLLTQYHTGTMIRRTPGIDEIFPVAKAEINPEDARHYRIKDGDEITLVTRRGKIRVRVMVTERSAKGVVFMPFHFAEAPANKLTNPALDPVAKEPELKVCAVRIEKVRSRRGNS